MDLAFVRGKNLFNEIQIPVKKKLFCKSFALIQCQRQTCCQSPVLTHETIGRKVNVDVLIDGVPRMSQVNVSRIGPDITQTQQCSDDVALVKNIHTYNLS